MRGAACAGHLLLTAYRYSFSSCPRHLRGASAGIPFGFQAKEKNGISAFAEMMVVINDGRLRAKRNNSGSLGQTWFPWLWTPAFAEVTELCKDKKVVHNNHSAQAVLRTQRLRTKRTKPRHAK